MRRVWIRGQQSWQLVATALTGLVLLTPGPGVTNDDQINSAKSVVDAYLAIERRKAYDLLSRDYKSRLRTHLKIADAAAYEKATRTAERSIRKHVYQKASMHPPNFITLTALISWEQEGYEGVMTMIFELVREAGTWKIESIVY